MQQSNCLRVMIVEDEPPMRRFLGRLLSRMEGFTVVSQCARAEEALEFLEASAVDLLVSDIRMAGMNGLQLAEKARGFYPHMHMIIITGYRSFEYARTAVPLNIDAFITKPVDQEEFEKVLVQIRETYQRECLSAARVLLEQAFACNDQTQFEELLSRQGCVPCQMLLIYYPGNFARVLSCVSHASDSLLYLHYQSVVLFFLPESSAAEIIRYVTVKLSRESWLPATGLCVHSFSFLSPVPVIAAIRDTCRNLMLKMVVPGSFPCCAEAELREQLESAERYNGDSTLCRKLEESVMARKWDAVWQLLQEIFLLWKRDRMPIAHLRRRIHSITALCAQAGVLDKDSFSMDEQIDEKLPALDSYEEILECLIHILRPHINGGDSSDDRERELFERIKSMALKQLSRNYSLQEVCGIFQVSQPYVRKIFLKYTGKTYNDFVSGEKIRYAVRLLQDNPQIPVKDLAATLGYEQLYFSTVFKKNTGMTPSQYRQITSEHSKTKVEEIL